MLSTSLAEDVVSLVGTQLAVLQSFLLSSQLSGSKAGQALLDDGLGFILRHLCGTQRRLRPVFLTTLEGCCEAANDFLRMSEKMDDLLQQQHCKPGPLSNSVVGDWSEFVNLLSQDAVFAAERSHIFIMQAINRTRLPIDLFSVSWEDEWTHNEVAWKLVDAVDAHLRLVAQFLGSDLLFPKVVVTACKATMNFYIRCLVEKADAVSKRRRHHDRWHCLGERRPFQHPKRALIRMMGDIRVLKDYFLGKVQGNATVARIISNEVYVLELIHECLDANDQDFLENFIVVIHKRTGGDTLVTQHFLGDLFLLMDQQRQLQHTVGLLQQDLHMISQRMRERTPTKKEEFSLVRLDEMLRALYEDRIVQGTLPLCWTCLPKIEAEDGSEVVSAKIRAITRGLADIRIRRKPYCA